MKQYSKKNKSIRQFDMRSKEGDSIRVKVSQDGIITIQARRRSKHAVFESVIVNGLSPKEVTAKSKGFFGRLWDRIKGAVKDVVDAVTTTIGPFICRPTISVGTQNGKIISVSLGLTCF